MLHALLVAAVLAVAPPAPRAPETPGPDEVLRRLFEGGRTFSEFLDAARRRTELWHRLADEGSVAREMVERAGAVGGTWRILAVAEDWCGDSAYNLPYVAKLADAVDGLELRVVNSTVGRPLMESHRTPDGRPATPTFILLDEGWNEAGCFVERPAELAAWYHENLGTMDSDALHEHIVEFYEERQGSATVGDVVEMLEAAAAGRARCAAGKP